MSGTRNEATNSQEVWWRRWEHASDRGDDFLANLAAQHIKAIEMEFLKSEKEQAVLAARKELA
jgi:hypothetical protein